MEARATKVLPAKRGLFETLPRELRDNMYNLLYQDAELEQHGANVHMRIKKPIVALRLVNRQFKHEYEERVLQNNRSKLVVSDNNGRLLEDIGSYQVDPAEIQCPNSATFTSELTVNMFACISNHYSLNRRCDSIELLPILRDWIHDFVSHKPYLRSIRVSLAVYYDSCIYDTLLALAAITMIPKVVELRLRACFGFLGPFEDNDNDTVTLAIWTPQNGIVHSHEAFEQCMQKKLLCSWVAASGGQGTWDGTIFP